MTGGAEIDPKRLVLEAIEAVGSCQTTALLENLQSKLSDAQVRDAVYELLDEGRIELTDNRQLRLLQAA